MKSASTLHAAAEAAASRLRDWCRDRLLIAGSVRPRRSEALYIALCDAMCSAALYENEVRLSPELLPMVDVASYEDLAEVSSGALLLLSGLVAAEGERNGALAEFLASAVDVIEQEVHNPPARPDLGLVEKHMILAGFGLVGPPRPSDVGLDGLLDTLVPPLSAREIDALQLRCEAACLWGTAGRSLKTSPVLPDARRFIRGHALHAARQYNLHLLAQLLRTSRHLGADHDEYTFRFLLSQQRDDGSFGNFAPELRYLQRHNAAHDRSQRLQVSVAVEVSILLAEMTASETVFARLPSLARPSNGRVLAEPTSPGARQVR